MCATWFDNTWDYHPPQYSVGLEVNRNILFHQFHYANVNHQFHYDCVAHNVHENTAVILYVFLYKTCVHFYNY